MNNKTRGRPKKDLPSLRVLARHGFTSPSEVKAALTRVKARSYKQIKTTTTQHSDKNRK